MKESVEMMEKAADYLIKLKLIQLSFEDHCRVRIIAEIPKSLENTGFSEIENLF